MKTPATADLRFLLGALEGAEQKARLGPWLLDLIEQAEAIERRHCPLGGRSHRVRVSLPVNLGVIVEQCRCGAVRRRYVGTRGVACATSDWEPPPGTVSHP